MSLFPRINPKTLTSTKFYATMHIERPGAISPRVAGIDFGYYDASPFGSSGKSPYMGGNIEFLPPFGSFKFGQLVTGYNLKSSRFKKIMKRLGIQASSTRAGTDPVWLKIHLENMGFAHVDEFMSVIPWDNPSGFKIMVADFAMADALLRANAAEDTDSKDKIPATAEIIQMINDYIEEPWGVEEGGEFIGIGTYRELVESNQKEIARLEKAYKDTVVRVPVLAPIENPGSGRVTPLPNSINGLILGNTILMPQPYYKPFRDEIIAQLAGNSSLSLKFIDTRVFWIAGGQLHCATSTQRE